MPELPDLQVFRSNLQKRFAGKTLRNFTIHNPKKLNTTEDKCKQAFEGQWLKSVKRHGKELFFEFRNKQVLGVHLMLKGEFVELPNHNVSGLILELQFDGGRGLAITDSMSLARVMLNPTMPTAPDALEYQFNVKYLKEQLKKSGSTPVKSFLMDQKVVRGIGNAYVDEILWEARISPFSHCDHIPEGATRELHRQIKQVLKDGEGKIKMTHPDIIAGEMRDFMKIHHPDKTHAPTGAEILVQKLNKRKTYYTREQADYMPEHQKPENIEKEEVKEVVKDIVTAVKNKATKKVSAKAGKKAQGKTGAEKKAILDDLPF